MVKLTSVAAGLLCVVAIGCGGDTATVINQTATTPAEDSVVIPDVVGDESAAAEALLESESLRVRTKLTYQYDSLIQIGQVAKQEPPASTPVPEFTVVTLYLAAGE